MKIFFLKSYAGIKDVLIHNILSLFHMLMREKMKIVINTDCPQS